jgi:hypothetical protein
MSASGAVERGSVGKKAVKAIFIGEKPVASVDCYVRKRSRSGPMVRNWRKKEKKEGCSKIFFLSQIKKYPACPVFIDQERCENFFEKSLTF